MTRDRTQAPPETDAQRLLAGMRRPVIVASHRRSGTHLTIDLIRKQFPVFSPKLRPLESIHHLYVSLDTLRPGHHNPMTPERVAGMLTRPNHRPVVKTHAEPSLDEFGDRAPFAREILERADVLYIVRDGRKVLASQHLYEYEFNADARSCFTDFIRSDFNSMPRPAYWVRHINHWRSRPSVHVFRYEDIVKKTEATIERLAGIFGETPVHAQPLLPKRTPAGIAHRVNRLLGRTESTTIPGRPRPGVEPQPWDRVFSADDRTYFDAHAGNVLVELGYEPDHAWAKPSHGGASA
ncbi:MAG: sulfotransferase domain-containing protein [Planctomycetota bacterium]